MRIRRVSILCAMMALSIGWHALASAAGPPRRFESLEAAVQALLTALREADPQALLEILGPEGRSLVWSGDPVADRRAGERFLVEYDRAHHLEGGDGKVILYIGTDDFPFPIPLVPDGPRWWWNVAAGTEEILNRRISRNEFSAIQVCLAYVQAQREYYAEDRNGDGVREYAQRLTSARGTRDGLYWEPRAGEKISPLGVQVARAEDAGGRVRGGPVPYFGYVFRVLSSQGSEAPGGASEYVVADRMLGGFGLIAVPAQYGVSGVMTFIVNHEGIVHQRDLGPATSRLASGIMSYDPGGPWQRVERIVTRP
jgi:hypothetical protein